jgi:hypothetical protein
VTVALIVRDLERVPEIVPDEDVVRDLLVVCEGVKEAVTVGVRVCVLVKDAPAEGVPVLLEV